MLDVTEESPPQTEASQRERRRRALEHAARVHERAAATHDDAAALYDRLGMPEKAADELEKAERERLGATADHSRAERESPHDDVQ